MKNSLRGKNICPIFGTPNDISENVLPTYEAVMKCYLFERAQLRQESNKDPSAKIIARNVAEKIKSVWVKASIPTVSHERINKKLMDYHGKYRNLMKCVLNR